MCKEGDSHWRQRQREDPCACLEKRVEKKKKHPTHTEAILVALWTPDLAIIKVGVRVLNYKMIKKKNKKKVVDGAVFLFLVVVRSKIRPCTKLGAKAPWMDVWLLLLHR